jgi:gamma-glutamylcyclotransferase (GGCT)/AIG2-like uncharacterized protein YtfP
MLIFFYGTLRAPEVRTHVLQEDTLRIEFCEASIVGCRLHKVIGATYPALVFDPDATQPIAGLLAKNLTKTMVEKLDVFEGQNYGRAPVEVTIKNHPNAQRAEAYLPKNLTNLYGKWVFEDWRKNHISKFIASLSDNCQIM